MATRKWTSGTIIGTQCVEHLLYCADRSTSQLLDAYSVYTGGMPKLRKTSGGLGFVVLVFAKPAL